MLHRVVAAATGLVLLTGCGTGTPSEPAGAQTERGPVSLAGGHATEVGAQELAFDVPSCNGEPEVDELVEDDGEIRIRIVTTMVVSGDAATCADSLELALQEELGSREVVDTESGETLRVAVRNAGPDSLAGLCEDMNVALAEDEPGLDTVEEAIAAFVATGGDFLSEASFEGRQIICEGEVVGRMPPVSRMRSFIEFGLLPNRRPKAAAVSPRLERSHSSSTCCSVRLYGTYSVAITHLPLPTDHPPISEVLHSPVELAAVVAMSVGWPERVRVAAVVTWLERAWATSA